MIIKELELKVKGYAPRSKWGQAIKGYALDMLDNIEDKDAPVDTITLGELVNNYGYMFIKIGTFRAQAWNAAKETSEGGNFLIYTQDIAKNLATPSEIKKCTRKDGSLRDPNRRETWLDCQTRAVYQAILLIQNYAGRVNYEFIKGGEA